VVAVDTTTDNSEQVKTLLVRRVRKVLIKPTADEPADEAVFAAFIENLNSVGYEPTPALADQCAKLSLKDFEKLHTWLMPALKELRGHKPFNPMYPNFPRQVMDASKAALFLNAFRHYITSGRWLPSVQKKEREQLDERGNLLTLDICDENETEKIFKNLLSSNSSISQQDKDDLRSLVHHFDQRIFELVPDKIPNREVKSFFLGLILAKGEQATSLAKQLCNTATDVLRLAVAMSDGDVSLAAPCKFRSFKRGERRALLNLLEKQKNIQEDMLRWKERWKRLGERLHPSEMQKTHPTLALAFTVLRNDLPIARFNSKIEAALIEKDSDKIIELLRTRPGDFARRLDHVLRSNFTKQDQISSAFTEVAAAVSTPVLLQVMHHFQNRPKTGELRVFLPKSEVGKARVLPSRLPEISATTCDTIAAACQSSLLARFAKLPPLGKCYIEPALQKFAVPGSQRSAAKALRTIARGSRLPLPKADTLRFFIWWKNGNSRTDLDLSAALFKSDFSYIDVVSYYNLKNFGGHHSGDIVDAPSGASEFIDISKSRCRERDVRYIVMCVNSFTRQPYCDLPECFAGWMARKEPDSGEIYEPRTVFDRLDLAANSKIAMPAIFDIEANEMLWLDLSLKGVPHWSNNVANNLHNIQLLMKAFNERKWFNLYDLLQLHAKARGQIVEVESDAETVFSVANETPFHLDRIASEFLA
jgi:hypothetical protein